MPREAPGEEVGGRAGSFASAAAGLAQGPPSPVPSSPLPRPSEGPGQGVLEPQPVSRTFPLPRPPWAETLGSGSRPAAGEAPVKPLLLDGLVTYFLL